MHNPPIPATDATAPTPAALVASASPLVELPESATGSGAPVASSHATKSAAAKPPSTAVKKRQRIAHVQSRRRNDARAGYSWYDNRANYWTGRAYADASYLRARYGLRGGKFVDAALPAGAFKPWPCFFEVRIRLNLRPPARAKLRALRAQPHPRQLSRGRCTRRHIDRPQPPVFVFSFRLRGFLRSETSGHPSPCPTNVPPAPWQQRPWIGCKQCVSLLFQAGCVPQAPRGGPFLESCFSNTEALRRCRRA